MITNLPIFYILSINNNYKEFNNRNASEPQRRNSEASKYGLNDKRLPLIASSQS